MNIKPLKLNKTNPDELLSIGFHFRVSPNDLKMIKILLRIAKTESGSYVTESLLFRSLIEEEFHRIIK